MNLEKRVFDRKYSGHFSIIIPSYNNIEYLKICIESIKKNSFYDNQIVVHVNQGDDGTIDYLEKEQIDFTRSSKNVGVCYSCNYAFLICKKEYIIFLNDDMYVCPDWDKKFFEKIKEIGHNLFYLSGMVIEPDGHNPEVFIKDFGDIDSYFDEKRLLASYKEAIKEDSLNIINPPNVIHKDVWSLIGGFSPEFTPGMTSDWDFLMKLWNIGIKEFIHVGDSVVYHFMSKSIHRIKKNRGGEQYLFKYGITNRLFKDFFVKRSISKKKFKFRRFICKLKMILRIIQNKSHEKNSIKIKAKVK